MTADTLPAPAADARGALERRFIIPEGIDLRLQLGSAGERAAAFLLDLAIIAAALIGLTILAISAVGAMGLRGDGAEMAQMIWILGAFLLRSGYFIAFELTPRAATPGKRMMGLRVAARDGGRLGGEAIFVRNALREIEVFLPLTFLAASAAVGDPVDRTLVLLGLIWSGVFLLFPLFNRDRLRVGDFVGGTWVVKAPKRSLAIDLAEDARERLARFDFTADQAGAYGIRELQVLEDVLRRRDKRILAAVADRIRVKIAWRPGAEETDTDFLTAYYAALRTRLENRLLFGHRRRDKFDKV
ncbi:MAG TPA: RDD family protein [Caulobacteraceae bacterium]|nr:RDD family protein [Caulobacteraceae bacterium]